jgi:hypothetical protein
MAAGMVGMALSVATFYQRPAEHLAAAVVAEPLTPAIISPLLARTAALP